MDQFTEAQRRLVLEYEHYSLDDLYRRIGTEAEESQDRTFRDRYVLGTPDVEKRGRRIVEDARASVCSGRRRLEQMTRDHRETMEPLEWVSTVVDVIVAHAIGVPPITVATALGKLCNRSLAKLCGDGTRNPS